VSLTAEREREGAYQTLLAYDITGIAASAAHDSSKPYDEEQAMAEAARCLRCECDACLKGCAHMQRYGRRPKTYAREIYTNENVFLGTRYANTMINSCTLCGLCGQRCPLNLSMAPLVAQTRRSMVASEKMPPSAHDFALRDMAQANSERASLLVAPAGRENGENYVFFPGCQLAATAPEHVEAAYAYLVEHLGAGVGLMLGCCGAPADWAGRDDLLAEGAKAIADAWEQCGRPTFILACSSCKDVLARKLPQLQAVTLWQAIAQHGLPAAASMADGALLNIHDACTARRDALTHESVRSLVASLGLRTEELRYSREDAKCCGFGGLVLYANREQEADFAADGAAEAQHDLLVYCAMCKGMFTEKGKRCFHLLDLLFAADPEPYALRQAPTLSERQDNRVALRQRFAERLLGLPALAAPPSSALPGYSLEISPEAQAKMEARLILVEDVVDAIKLALEDPGICFSNPARGTRLASVRKQFVTYWVEFKVDATIIIVVSVYSHRMEVIAQAPQ
jgi:Fe-S oxidoreductase